MADLKHPQPVNPVTVSTAVTNTATSTITSESPVSTRHRRCRGERLDATGTAGRASLDGDTA